MLGTLHLVVPGVPMIVLAALLSVLDILLTLGFFALQPNEAQVLVLFGEYVGTVKKSGFHWANPFSVHHDFGVTVQQTQPGKAELQRTTPKRKYRFSLRARNFETATLKVNDQRGNPIDIGAVVVWRTQRRRSST
jgi:regulator of protease activity HflC (stomatin/prohibitin superfamily)